MKRYNGGYYRRDGRWFWSSVALILGALIWTIIKVWL